MNRHHSLLTVLIPVSLAEGRGFSSGIGLIGITKYRSFVFWLIQPGRSPLPGLEPDLSPKKGRGDVGVGLTGMPGKNNAEQGVSKVEVSRCGRCTSSLDIPCSAFYHFADTTLPG